MKKALSILVRILGHSIGVSVVFIGTFWIHGTREVATSLAEAWEHGLFEQNAMEFWLQLGLSACLWSLIAIAAALGLNASREKEREPRRVVLARRGSAMTETLIVIPVLLLLVLGLLQLTLNNTAALFTSLAAFQAGRTVYLWSPEVQSKGWARNDGVSKAEVEEKAKISAASVLAPVTASSYSDACGTSREFDAKLEAMMSVTLGAAGSFGATSASGVKALAAGKPLPFQNELTVAKAYDTDSFVLRGPVKMYLAYCHTDVTYRTVDGNNIVGVTYQHKQTMPLVGKIFGSVGASGVFAQVQRSFSMPEQIHPNPHPPTSIFALLYWNPFSSWL